MVGSISVGSWPAALWPFALFTLSLSFTWLASQHSDRYWLLLYTKSFCFSKNSVFVFSPTWARASSC